MVPFVANGNTLTMFINGKPELINSTHVHWRKIKAALPTATVDDIVKLLDTKEIIYNGVYYMYMIDKYMFCIYSSIKNGVHRCNRIEKFSDLEKSDGDPCNLPDQALHTGTYATIDELLDDYVERFI